MPTSDPAAAFDDCTHRWGYVLAPSRDPADVVAQAAVEAWQSILASWSQQINQNVDSERVQPAREARHRRMQPPSRCTPPRAVRSSMWFRTGPAAARRRPPTRSTHRPPPRLETICRQCRRAKLGPGRGFSAGPRSRGLVVSARPTQEILIGINHTITPIRQSGQHGCLSV